MYLKTCTIDNYQESVLGVTVLSKTLPYTMVRLWALRYFTSAGAVCHALDGIHPGEKHSFYGTVAEEGTAGI